MRLPLAIAMRVFLVCRQWAWGAGLLGLGFGGATIITCAVKRLNERPRPELSPPLVPMPADFSFPSGHTAPISAFALCLTIIAGRHHTSMRCGTATRLAVLIAGRVGFSRLYLQVHDLSDVVAGALLGLFGGGSCPVGAEACAAVGIALKAATHTRRWRPEPPPVMSSRRSARNEPKYVTLRKLPVMPIGFVIEGSR